MPHCVLIALAIISMTVKGNELKAPPISVLTDWCILENIYLPTSVYIFSKNFHDTPAEPVTFPRIISPPSSKDRRRSIYYSSMIFLVKISSAHEVPLILQEIARAGSTSRDCFIFLASEELILSHLNVLLENLRQSIAFATDFGKLMFDPKLNLANEIQTDDFSEPFHFPSPRRYGFNLNEKHFRITGCPELPPYQFTISKTPQVEFDGSYVRIFQEISKTFNYTFEMHAPEGQQYGSVLENGTWTGMVGDLVNDDFHFAIVSGHLPRWYGFFDWTWTVDFARLLFAAREPLNEEVKWEAVFYPFELDTWVALLTLYIGMSVTMVIFLHIELKAPTWSYSLYWSLVTTLKISLEQNVKVLKGIKFLVLLWLILTIVTGTMYKSNLASYLTIPSIEKLPSSYEDLAARGDWTILLNHIGDAEYSFFKYSESPTIKSIAKRLEEEPNPIACGHRVLLHPKTACIGWVPFVKFVAASTATYNLKHDAIKFSNKPAVFASVSVPFKKDSIYKDTFAPIISVINEMGILSKWGDEVTYFVKKKGRDFVEQDGHEEVLNLLKMYGEIDGTNQSRSLKIMNLVVVFVILAVGLIAATASFLIELGNAGVVTDTEDNSESFYLNTYSAIHVNVNSIEEHLGML